MTQQNKPHYTCPIIAAYMAKYFGVKFLTERGNELFYDGEFREVSVPHGIYGNCVYYVNPESMSVFKPKDGDIGLFQNKSYTYDKANDNWNNIFINANNGKLSATIPINKLQTAFRDNKPFFWYED